MFSDFACTVREESETQSSGEEVETIVRLGCGGGDCMVRKYFADRDFS